MSDRAGCWVRRLRARRREAFTLVCLLAGGFGPAPRAVAQLGSGPLGQYTAPGGLRLGERLTEESFELSMEQARWRFGGLRMAPFIGVRNAQYHNNVFATSDEGEQTEDLSVTLGAGFDAYFKTGGDVFYRIEVQPDYVYWYDLEERSQVVGRYSASLNAFLNRLTMSVMGRRYEVEQIVTPEFAQPVTSLEEGFDALLRLRLSSRFSIGFSGDVKDLAYSSESEGNPEVPEFSGLDRRQTTGQASVFWSLPNGIELGAGWQVIEADFEENARPLSTEGSGPQVSLFGNGNKVDFRVEISQSTLEPSVGSLLPERDVVAGRFETSFQVTPRINFDLYGQRGQLFSIDESFTDFTHQRYGVRFGIPLGELTGVDFFVELGEDEYESVSPELPERIDDALSWGAKLRVPLPRKAPKGLGIELGYRVSELDSNLPGLDRDFGGPIFNLTYSLGRVEQLVWQ